MGVTTLYTKLLIMRCDDSYLQSIYRTHTILFKKMLYASSDFSHIITVIYEIQVCYAGMSVLYHPLHSFILNTIQFSMLVHIEQHYFLY